MPWRACLWRSDVAVGRRAKHHSTVGVWTLVGVRQPRRSGCGQHPFGVDVGGYHLGMSSHSADVPPETGVVLTNPDEDCSPDAFHALLDEVLAGPEPELESVGAVEALDELRVDARA
jgi:hypothetical protein